MDFSKTGDKWFLKALSTCLSVILKKSNRSKTLSNTFENIALFDLHKNEKNYSYGPNIF